MTRILVAASTAVWFAGCASGYTVIDRSSVVVSENSRVTAASLLPGGDQHPMLLRHLGLAEEVYQKQLSLLKERRNKVRARRRELNFASFGILASSALAAGTTSIAATATDKPREALIGAGVSSLVGLGVGTVLQIAGLMQEEPASIDDKIRHLDRMYQDMLDRVHLLMSQSPSSEAQAGEAVERFINEALEINVKG
jgi:hypothetical protein